MKKLLFAAHFSVVFVSIVLLSCVNNEQEWQTVRALNAYSIDVPAGMKPTTELNSVASLQYEWEEEELYTICIRENKEEIKKVFLENGFDSASKEAIPVETYAQLVLTAFENNMHVITHSPIQKIKSTQGYLGVQTEITSEIDGNEGYYIFSVLETREDYYQIVSWTLNKFKSRHRGSMLRMCNSFRILK
jgi:hypothetical protein